MIFGALLLSLLFAWLNFLLTGRWAHVVGALNGWRWPWYAAALATLTALALARRQSIGAPAGIPRAVAVLLLLVGAGTLVSALVFRLPITTWAQIPFKDDWTELFQQAVIGVDLLQRGAVVGWNWWLLGGYPTSTDIAQSFAVLAFAPMTVLGDRVGYHVFHAAVFLSLPLFVWRDIASDGDRRTALLAAAFACFFTAGYFATLGNSGDTNSLVGVFCATLALAGSRAARAGRRWGGPILLLGLTLGLYSHVAFVVYAGIFLTLEALYFRDRLAFFRLAVAGCIAVIAALPVHWESLRYPAFVSFNNTVFDPSAPKDWGRMLKTLYYNVEILAVPHRWFNDYRSLANVWLPVLAVAAFALERSRVGFYACAVVLAQFLLRLNTSEAGAIFDRIQHMFPVLAAPALAGVVHRFSGTPGLATAWTAVVALYVATSFTPVRHVRELRDWDPALIDRISRADGMVLVEISPHRDMDPDPNARTPTTPFDVHFEGLLPGLAGQRFYSQMIDGWVWNIWRGQVVGAGTWQGRLIDRVPRETFAAEMSKWGVRHLFVWEERTREYLIGSGRFAERWRGGHWSHFEFEASDTRSVVTPRGSGQLTNLDFLGAAVELADVGGGDQVVVRANYYPAWRAWAGDTAVPLHAVDGQLAFRAPMDGSYVVRLEYPRYRWLSALALAAFALGAAAMSRFTTRARFSRPLVRDRH